MTRTIGLISNPNSGHNRDHFPGIETRVAQTAVQHVVTDAAEQIPDALRELAAAGVDLLAINGGDGTVAAILGEMLERSHFSTPPAIAILPGGTANMTAGDIGMRGSLPKALERFCAFAHEPHSRAESIRRSLLRVTDGEGCIHHGMFLGAGAIIQGTEYAHREVHARGLRDDFSLALTTARTVWGVVRGDPEFARSQPIQIRLDGEPAREHDTLILALSTLERLAFGMRPFYGAGPGDLRLTIMDQGCSRFARTFTSIVRGKPGPNAVPEQGYFSHNADSLTLTMEGKVNLDGEIIDVAGTLDVAATPALEFLRL